MAKRRSSLYASTQPDDLTIRDHLARDRTSLANERTYLSYLRTAFGFMAAGGTLIKLFPDERSTRVLGCILLLAGVLIAAFGTWRFTTVRASLNRLIAPRPE